MKQILNQQMLEKRKHVSLFFLQAFPYIFIHNDRNRIFPRLIPCAGTICIHDNVVFFPLINRKFFCGLVQPAKKRKIPIAFFFSYQSHKLRTDQQPGSIDRSDIIMLLHIRHMLFSLHRLIRKNDHHHIRFQRSKKGIESFLLPL